MILDERSKKILNTLLNHPNVTSNALAEEYVLSQRQLGYSLDKINQWLMDMELPVIERTRNGYFLIDKKVYSKLNYKKMDEFVYEKLLTGAQREKIIILMLISNNDLSLNHFTSEFKISKNTVLEDLKKIKKTLDSFDLSLRYYRSKGYVVEGSEFQIRKLLIVTFYQMFDFENSEEMIGHLTVVTPSQIQHWEERIANVEQKLELKFTDEKLKVMPYILAILTRRANEGNNLSPFYISYEDVSDTKEYLATEELLKEYQRIPVEEKLFITLHLLTTNIHWAEDVMGKAIPELPGALRSMLDEFENRACISFQDKETLLSKLLLHMKPAYYRTKYHLSEYSEAGIEVSNDFLALHHLVQKSTQPLANLIGQEIPESETKYLTMLIGGWLSNQGEKIEEKIKALVVCPQGVSVSRLMLSELKDLFPEFVFLDALSVREFNSCNLQYDLVFSPTEIEAGNKLFITSSFLSSNEKTLLRKQVMMHLYGYVPQELNTSNFMKIIDKYAEVHDREKLAQEIEEYVYQDDARNISKPQRNDERSRLSEVLLPENIIVRNAVDSWEEAISLAAKPLIEHNKIEKQYAGAVLQKCTDPYIVIAPNVAIPHAAPEDGVKDMSISLLKLERGVAFTPDHTINLVFLIAAIDKQQHLAPMMQLTKIVNDHSMREALLKAPSREEIHKLIAGSTIRTPGKEKQI